MLRLEILLFTAACSSTSPQPDADFCPRSSPFGPPPPPDLAAAQCVGQTANPALGSSPLANQLQESDVIFHGTVVQLGASTIPGVDPTQLAIVRLDSLVYTPAFERDAVAAFVGETITVAMPAFDVPVGSSATFLTTTADYNAPNHWLGVADVAHFADADSHLAAAIPAVADLFARDPLYARVASADRIVAGTVTSLTDLAPSCLAASCPPSEHCTEWGEAIVEVDATLCGGALQAPVRVAFPTSIDIAWYMAPKLAAGGSAVLLLHHTDVGIPASTTPPDLMVLDPMDVQSRDREAALRALLASPPSP